MIRETIVKNADGSVLIEQDDNGKKSWKAYSASAFAAAKKLGGKMVQQVEVLQ